MEERLAEMDQIIQYQVDSGKLNALIAEEMLQIKVKKSARN